MAISCLCIACWICKATRTHSQYIPLFAFPLQQWLRECISMLHNMYIACFVKLCRFSVAYTRTAQLNVAVISSLATFRHVWHICIDVLFACHLITSTFRIHERSCLRFLEQVTSSCSTIQTIVAYTES